MFNINKVSFVGGLLIKPLIALETVIGNQNVTKKKIELGFIQLVGKKIQKYFFPTILDKWAFTVSAK